MLIEVYWEVRNEIFDHCEVRNEKKNRNYILREVRGVNES